MIRRMLDKYIGQTFSFSGNLTDDDGNAIDLSSATMVWRIALPGDTKARKVISTVTGDAFGDWTVNVAAADTEDSMAHGYYNHRGEATVGANVYVFTDGRITLRRDIDT